VIWPSERRGGTFARGRPRWLRGARARLREEELAAGQQRRQTAELDHAARPEPPEPAGRPWHDASHDRRAERLLAGDDLGRDIGRAL